MKIRTKFILLPLFVGVFSITIVLFSMTQIFNMINYHYVSQHPKLEAIYEIEINVNEAASDVYLEKTDPKIRIAALNRFKDSVDDYTQHFNTYKSFLLSESAKNIAKQLSELLAQYTKLGYQVFDQYEQQYNHIVERRDLLNNNMEIYLDDILQSQQKLSNMNERNKLHAADEIEINMHELISAVRGYLLKRDTFLKERISDSLKDLDYWIESYKKEKLSSEEDATIKQLRIDADQIKYLSLKIISLEDSIANNYASFEELHQKLDIMLDEKIQIELSEKLIKEAEDIEKLLMTFSIVTVAILFTLMLVLYLTIRPIVKTIDILRNSTRNFLHNDIVEISVKTDDELGELSRDLEYMMLEVRKEAQQRSEAFIELDIAKKQAEEANKAKSNFLASMSHEIRTPMTGLLGFIGRLKNSEKDLGRIQQFNVVENSGQTLLTIINDILDFSKIESGKVELDSSPFSLHKLFSSSLDVYASLASTKNISLHGMIDENLPSCFLGDETRLKQVIFNLLSNAIKFTNENGNVTVNARYNDDKQTVYISVIDTGIGIAKENLEKIFESFSQEDVSTTRKFGGTGLGLSISSHLARLMGSELKVESVVTKGSKFYFEIPLKVCTQENNLTIEEAHESLTKTADLKGHVLIVEDNKTNQMLMSMILDDLGLTYDIADNGAEATLNYKLKKYDLILMDENMPIMNGIEATKNIRERERDESITPIPIIAVTANALTGDKEKFIDAGMNDYISKPYTEEDVVKVLQKYL